MGGKCWRPDDTPDNGNEAPHHSNGMLLKDRVGSRRTEGGQGDRGINATNLFLVAFMPRKPLDALEDAYTGGSGWGWF